MIIWKLSQQAKILRLSLIFILLILPLSGKCDLLKNLARLQQAYPEHIQTTNENYIIWKDGTKMLIEMSPINKSFQEKLDDPTLFDQLTQARYPVGKISKNTKDDPGRIRYEPFFQKMYGATPQQVRNNLTIVYWMPRVFGKKFKLSVTKINAIDKKIMQISHELEILVFHFPYMRKFLENPGGTFNWRYIHNTSRLSPHSFGMTLDINAENANYWQWDLKRKKLPIEENQVVNHQSKIPWEIIEIFERYHFIWGGKWYHYDTMHFEYRPELFE